METVFKQSFQSTCPFKEFSNHTFEMEATLITAETQLGWNMLKETFQPEIN